MDDHDRTKGPRRDARKGAGGRGRAGGLNKTPARTPIYTDGNIDASVATRHPAIVVFSSDEEIVNLAAQAATEPWIVKQCADAGEAREGLSRLRVRLVVIDDQKIDAPTRGWLLEQVRKYAGSALVIYIASDHDLDGERRTRAHPVQFYTARPIDAERIRKVLESFVRTAS
jgi:DNA-binding NtrC family response regulator